MREDQIAPGGDVDVPVLVDDVRVSPGGRVATDHRVQTEEAHVISEVV